MNPNEQPKTIPIKDSLFTYNEFIELLSNLQENGVDITNILQELQELDSDKSIRLQLVLIGNVS